MSMEVKAKDLLYELWIQYAEKLLEKVIVITDLSEEQANALRRVALRPNDFIVLVEGETMQVPEDDV
jgi:hypothetical protein